MLMSLGKLHRPVNVHLELNTGMNRLGQAPNELEAYLNVLKSHKSLTLEGVMTHLADADNEASDVFTKEQSRLFDKAVDSIISMGFKPKYIHIAQTAGSTKVNSKYANSMRIGIGIYGINPLSLADRHRKDLEGLSPVLDLKSTVIKVIDLKPGDRVSYNGIFTASKQMRIGVLPLGYYEGIPRELSNKGVVTFGDEVFPVVGRVCMNHTMIDLSDSRVDVGSAVTVISSESNRPNSIEQICNNYGLFSYSLMTGLSNSTRRLIV